MDSEAEYDRIVGALYDAALHPDTWKNAFTDLSAWTGADVFHFLRWDAASQQAPFNLHTDGIDQAIEQYGAYYGAIDPRRMLVSQTAPGEVSACQHHFDDRYVSRSEFYQDYLMREGMRHTLSSVLVDEGDSQMLIGLVRERQRGAFDDAQIGRLQ
ncbi:MAG TPA: helix-turn-helix transcriptional regulator, partial [Albitalea sp.]|nr:helix-turn-helix transcriptional regulator [Albitalea sp.]